MPGAEAELLVVFSVAYRAPSPRNAESAGELFVLGKKGLLESRPCLRIYNFFPVALPRLPSGS